MLPKVLNADFLWLLAEHGAPRGQGLGTWGACQCLDWLDAVVASLFQEFLPLLWKLFLHPPKNSLRSPFPPIPQPLLQLWLLPNLSGRLNMRLFRAATCVGIDTEVLLPRRGQGSSIKQTACLDPVHQRFHTAGTGNTPVSCLNNQGVLEAHECET